MSSNKKGFKVSLDLYAENQRKLIAALLYSGTHITRIVQIIRPDDFEDAAFSEIFSKMLEISRSGNEVSITTVASGLEEEGLLKKVGGPAQLYNLREEGRKVLMEATPESLARTIKQFSAKRKAFRIVKEAEDKFKDDSGVTAKEASSQLQDEINEILYSLSDDSNVLEISESVPEYRKILEQRFEIYKENLETSEGLQGIPCMLPTLNSYTTGWKPGQLITVGARTGIGKSVFATNAAAAACIAGKSVLFISLEMEATEIQDRIVSSISGITLNKLIQGRIEEEDIPKFEDAMKLLQSMKLRIDTDTNVTVDSIRAKALQLAQSEFGLDFIIVDYIQLMTPVGRRNESRQELVAGISRGMKLLAKNLKVPIMGLVQLNRKTGEGEEDAMPTIDNIRESGAVGQDSDVVILLHRDKAVDDQIQHTSIILAKNRGGIADRIIRCHSILECSLFKEVIRHKDSKNSEDLSPEEMSEIEENFDIDDFGLDEEDEEEDYEF